MPCGTQMISSSIWHWLAATEKNWIKFFVFWALPVATDYFWILERPAFAASGRLARTGSSFRRPRCEWATFPVALLWASPSSQPPNLPEIDFRVSTVLPTKCITSGYTVLPHLETPESLDWVYVCHIPVIWHIGSYTCHIPGIWHEYFFRLNSCVYILSNGYMASISASDI